MTTITQNILSLQAQEPPLSLRRYFEANGSYPEPYLQFADKLREDGMLLIPQPIGIIESYVGQNREELAFYLSQIFDLEPEPIALPSFDSSSTGTFSRDLEYRDIQSPDTIIDHLGEDDYLLSDFDDEYWDEWQEYGEPPNIEGYQCVGMTIQEVPVYRLPELEPTFREDPVEIGEEYNPEDGNYYSIEEDVEMPIISSLGENDRLISDLPDEYWDAWQHGDGCPPRIKGYECVGFTPEDCGLEPIYRESSTVVEQKFDATPRKYAHIDFTPPEGARKAAERGLEIRKQQPKSQRGGLTNAEASKEGIGSGVQRAVNLKNGSPLSPKVVKQMKAFFDRHSAFKHKHSEEPEGKAITSWKLWGGDAGYSWAKKVVAQMEAADKKERQDAIARFNKKYNDSLTEEALLDDIRNDSQSPTYEWVTGYNRGDSWVPGYVRYYRDRAGSTSKKKDLTRSDAEKEDDPLLPAVEASIERTQPVIDQWLKTLKKEIQRLGSYEAVLEKLPDLAKKLPLDDLGQIFQEGNIVSHLIGLSEDAPTE